MADDSEAMSGQDDDRDNDDVMEVVSPDGINSTTDNLPDTQLISSGNRPPDVVCDVVCGNEIQSQRCSSSDVQITAENLSLHKSTSSRNIHDVNTCDITEPITINSHSNGDEHSDNESEIIVDDSPLPVINTTGSTDMPDDISKETQLCNNGSGNPVRLIGRSRSVTPSPSYIRLATPSTPGTPRLRSGSVSGTTYAPLSPKPSPSARATPGERQRAGSMGEIEMRDKILGREIKHGIRIIDDLDILQLPRPRNPGGILPMNGHSFNCSNEALNLTIDDRQHSNHDSDNINLVSSSFSSITPSTNVSGTASKRPNTSYLISNIIRTTPSRQRSSNHSSTTEFNSLAGRNRGCAINESVERPLPSSIVDSEGVAKKIARLNSEGFLCSSSIDNLWGSSGTRDTSNDHISRVRVISDKTPPERPKPPRRTVLSPADNGSVDMTHTDRSFIPGARRRVSPGHLFSIHRESTPSNGHTSGNLYATSPDDEICHLQHHYKCRLCNYTSASYNMLQLHSSKHGGHKTFKCSLCDYTTQEKSHFRKHRRLHHKTSPVNILRCIKCSFVTSLSRKLREHYNQAHPDMPDVTQSGIGPSRHMASPPRIIGTHGLSAESTSVYRGHYYDSPMLVSRNRLGYPYTLTGRQAPINYPIDQFDITYSSFRDHHSNNIASDFIRTIETTCQAATSTVTSSSYFMSSGIDNSHPIQDVHTCNNHGPCHHSNCNGMHAEIKIKVENDVDNVSDVSSTANSSSLPTPDITRTVLDNPNGRLPTAVPSLSSAIQNGSTEPLMHLQQLARHRNDDRAITRNPNNELPTDLSSPRKHRAISEMNNPSGTTRVSIDLDLSSEVHPDTSFNKSPPPSNTVIKSDNASRGIQCVLPVIKTEIDLDGDYYDFFGRPRFQGVDRAVQCNLSHSNTSASNSRSQCPTARTAFRSQSVSESELSEHHSSVCGESRCEYCGITFDDEVLFSIHLGCHSHTDPFKCNVCGKQCGNKYGFYSHIMRGHQL